MAHRIERIASAVREVVSDAIANRLSDPRVNRLTSVTRVEVSADSQVADVHVSVMGDPGEARTTMRGLESARGMIQTLVAKRLDIRRCPALRFHLDTGIKRGVEIVHELERLEAERAQRESGGQAANPDDEGPG